MKQILTLLSLTVFSFSVLAFVSCSKKESPALPQQTADAPLTLENTVQEPVSQETTVPDDESHPISLRQDLPPLDVSKIDLQAVKISPFEYAVPDGNTYGRENPYGNLREFPDLYVLGWSNDGRVALCETIFEEGRGGSTAHIYIQSLVTDNILWEKNYSSDELDQESLLKKSLESDRDRINKAFNQYDISLTDASIKPLPPIFRGKEVHITVEKEKLESEDDFTPALKYAVYAEYDGKNKKISSRLHAPAYDVYLCGHIMSPAEDRVMVLYAEEQMSFECTKLKYQVSGCDLTYGFK